MIVALLFSAGVGYRFYRLYQPAQVSMGAPATPSWPEVPVLDPRYVHVFEPGAGAPSPASEDEKGLAARYRYAGAFITSTGPDSSRMAVIDDIEQGKEHLVSSGDRINDMILLRVEPNFVELKVNGRSETLRRRGLGEGITSDVATTAHTSTETGPLELAPNRRFGNRVGKRHWVLSRDKLMNYYKEVMDDPERLVNVFDSMEPRYRTDGSINGYQLNVQGEKDFFDGVGLTQGDAVSRVNSVDMSNRGRAEAFLRAFANNQVTVLYLDIERQGGKSERVRYDIR